MAARHPQATSSDAVARAVSAVAAPLGIRDVYVATNDRRVDYAGALQRKGFQCHEAEELFAGDLGADNHLLFAMEMKLVDDAAVCIRTFNDATPWYFSTVRKPSYHLVDRSMHDYVYGFSPMGIGHTELKTPLVLALLGPQEVYDALREEGPDRHAFTGVGRLPRLWPTQDLTSKPSYQVALVEKAQEGLLTSTWPMRHEGQGVHVARVEVRPGSGASFTIAVGGEPGRVLYPASQGRWPVAREVVHGPGEPPDADHVWWLGGDGEEGDAVGPTAASGPPGALYEVRLDTCGRRQVAACRRQCS